MLRSRTKRLQKSSVTYVLYEHCDMLNQFVSAIHFYGHAKATLNNC